MSTKFKEIQLGDRVLVGKFFRKRLAGVVESIVTHEDVDSWGIDYHVDIYSILLEEDGKRIKVNPYNIFSKYRVIKVIENRTIG